MKALESLPSTASLSRIQRHSRSLSHHPDVVSKPKNASFSDHRRVILTPIQTKHGEPNRPAHLPAHFVKAPYPFSARKDFPKPEHQLNNNRGTTYHDIMDERHVVGIVARDGEFDVGGRPERNEGIVHGTKEAILWLTMKRKRGDNDELTQITVPNSLTMKSIEKMSENTWKRGRIGSNKNGTNEIDFDDMLFARQLQDGYRRLNKPCVLRAFSAKKLHAIRIEQVNTWSGTQASGSNGTTSRLLAAHGGFDMETSIGSPFTEQNLLRLFQTPKLGHGRYTWTCWAQRCAAINTSVNKSNCPESVQAVQFEQAFSVVRISIVLATMLIINILSVLLWIFLGGSALPEKRVESGMVIEVFGLLLQGVVFAAWLHI
jgi:hypothetical protein